MFRAFLGKESLDKLRKETEKKMSDILMTSVTAVVVPALQQEIKEQKIDFEGKLKDSFKVVKLNQYSVEVRSSVDYVQMVDQGTEKREVDEEELSKIIRWAAQKISSTNAEKIGEDVAEKIEREGSEAHPFVEAALETAEQPLIDLIQREVRKAVG